MSVAASSASAAAAGDGSALALFRAVAERRPELPALVVGGERLRYAGLAERVARLAGGLAAGRAGVVPQPGDRALVLIPMSLDLYATLLALFARGVAALFVEPWLGPRGIVRGAELAEPSLFLGGPRAHLLRLASPLLRRIPGAVTTGGRLGPLPAPHTLRELADAPPVPPIPLGSDALALVAFSTGSSGVPKGSTRSHGVLRAQHEALARELPSVEGEAEITTFPVFALHNLASGVPTVVPPVDLRAIDAVDPAAAVATARAHAVRTVTASPPFVDALARHPDASRLALRRIVTGGAPVGDGALRRWRGAFPGTPIVVAYGSSEAEPVAVVEAEERLALRNPLRPQAPGYCAGRLGAGLRLKVVRLHRGPIALGPAGWAEWEVAPGEIGELLVAGEHVATDYYRDPAAVAAGKIRDADGTVWHRMGDTGSLDPAGWIWLAGRLHSTIWRDGVPAHAGLLEQAARGDDPRVRRAGAVGLPDPRLGERAVVVVEGEGGGDLAAAAARRIADAGLVADAVRATARPLPVDPRHRSKIDYGALRRLAATMETS